MYTYRIKRDCGTGNGADALAYFDVYFDMSDSLSSRCTMSIRLTAFLKSMRLSIILIAGFQKTATSLFDRIQKRSVQ